MKRKQCAKCPWKVSTDPHQIPGGYCEEKHKNLRGTLAEPGALSLRQRRLMACHESPVGSEVPCVGWLHHQLGDGNNLGLRLAVIQGQVDANYELDGDQHPDFESTLPK